MTAPLAFITGASSGIGQALAARYAQAGWRLALAARRVGEIENWARSQGLGPERCLAYAADVQKIDSIVGAGQRCIAAQGVPDVVIANAGISVGIDTEIREDLDVLADTLAINNVGLAASAVYQLDTSTNQSRKLNTVSFDNVSISTPPTAVADTYYVNEDTALTVPAGSGVLFNDSDPEGDILAAQVVTGTTGLTLNGDGSFTYVPPTNFSGTASFTYVAKDGVLNSQPIAVTLMVNPANEAPSFTKGADQRIVSNLGAQVVAGWATAVSQGTGESDQLFDFVVTNTNNPLFASQPAVGADGTLTYASAAGATGTATVSVAIHDNGGRANGGVDTSSVQTFTITIDDPPVVAATAASMAYTENATVALDPGVLVTDTDSANLVSATVTMTTNYVNGQDTLAFVNQNGIVGTWTAGTGALALTGSSTVASYQAALRSITYNNNSDNPTTATRTVTFVANDGILDSSTASRTVTVAAVSDAPVMTASGSSLAYTEGGTPLLDPGITVTDADSANLLSVTVDMTPGMSMLRTPSPS